MKLNQYFIYILLIVVLAVAACSSNVSDGNTDPTEETSSIEPTATLESKSEDEVVSDGSVTALESPLNATSPLAAPRADAVEIEPTAIVIEVGENTGAVTGVLKGRHVNGNMIPVANAVIGLGTLVPNDEGEGFIGLAYSPSDSRRTDTDENGIFIVEDLEPGTYGIILDAVISQSFLTFPDDSAKDLIFDAVAGEQTDLGILEYESLSYPDFNQ